jgi:hypothetical protein
LAAIARKLNIAEDAEEPRIAEKNKKGDVIPNRDSRRFRKAEIEYSGFHLNLEGPGGTVKIGWNVYISRFSLASPLDLNQ